jgi:hypothetical protein
VRFNPKAVNMTFNTIFVISGLMLYLIYLFFKPFLVIGLTSAVLLIYWYWNRRLQ